MKISIGTFIKIEPFVFNVLYILGITLYMFELDDVFIYIMNTNILYSPILWLFAMIRSKLAKFCVYHRLAVTTPVLGNIFVFINDWIYQFNISAVVFSIIIIVFTTILTIFTGIKVFRRNERRNAKGTDKRLVRTTDKEIR